MVEERETAIRVCTRCVLPETFPGISFDEDGVCSHCIRHAKDAADHSRTKERYRSKFLTLLSSINQSNSTNSLNQSTYDVLVAYSGGKDSSYTLKILNKNYGLRVLAITFNHGFFSEQAWENIRAVTGSLGVDRLTFSPNKQLVRSAFRESIHQRVYPLRTLLRASAICNTCMNLVKSFMLKTAIEMGVPLVAYGWSPGQAPIRSSVLKLNPSMIRKTQSIMLGQIFKLLAEEMVPFIPQERHFRLVEAGCVGSIYIIHPLALLDYDESRVLREIEPLGWKLPRGTDANSTNCLLNAFAIEVHLAQHGFHPYVCELASLVRQGYIDRGEALKRINSPVNRRVVEEVERKLEVN